jgi:hypothetical protein
LPTLLGRGRERHSEAAWWFRIEDYSPDLSLFKEEPQWLGEYIEALVPTV